MIYFDIVTKREDFKKLSKTILLELLQNKWSLNLEQLTSLFIVLIYNPEYE